jgi:putative SOS response-associated peptidase YedK
MAVGFTRRLPISDESLVLHVIEHMPAKLTLGAHRRGKLSPRPLYSAKRKSDKQKVMQVLEVQAGLEEVEFAPGDDLRPQSMQPVIYTNEAGERQVEMMRWGFKLPDRLLFNARSEGIAQANFWKDAFLTGHGIAPGDAVFEWKKMPVGEKKPKYEITIAGQEPFGMAAVGNSGRTRRQSSGSAPSPF